MKYLRGDFGDDPRKTLEDVARFSKFIPFSNRILKFKDTYNLILRTEERIKDKGLTLAFVESFGDL